MKNRIVFLGAASLLALQFLACTGDPGPVGPKGDEGPSSDPSINAIVPNKVFLARTVDITVSGFNTNWTDATQLDFGNGIIVVKQTIASPTAIVATIEVSETAAIGARDVNVIDADGTRTYKGAFKIETPLDLVLSGTVAQGSILVTQAKQLDLGTPFDTTSTGDGFFDPFVYTNISVSGSSGINATVESVDLYSAGLLVLLDVETPAGPGDLTMYSGPVGDSLASPAPGSIDVAARMPEVIPEGGSVKSNFTVPFGTLLYSFTPSGPGLYSITVNASSLDANPNLVVLPKSGRFADLLDVSENPTILATNTDPYYFVYWDNSGEVAYSTTLQSTKVVSSDVDPNETCAQAQPAGALPANIKNLFLSSKTDVDWVSFDVMAADIGQIVRVKTSAGDATTDTVVQVFASNCTTPLGGPSADMGYHEDLKSTPIVAAGKHFVKVTHAPYEFKGKLYNLSIALETPMP